MALFIILTSAEADQVRGPSAVDPAASLNPIERQGGKFILGVGVLADPRHEEHWEFLGTLPQLDSADENFPPAIELPEDE